MRDLFVGRPGAAAGSPFLRVDAGRAIRLSFLLLAVAFPPAARAAPQEAGHGVSPVDLIEQALEAYLQQRYDDSIDLFQQVLMLDKKNPTAQQGLESALHQKRLQQQQEEARERPALDAAKKSIARHDWADAMDRLRSVLQRVPDHQEARTLAKKIRGKVEKQFHKAKFQTSDWFYHKGVLAYLEGDWFQAARAWEQVYAFNPDKVFLVAKIELAKQNLDAQQRDERVSLYQNVAWDNLRQSKYAEAVESWQEVLRLDPDNSEALEGLEQAREAAAKSEETRKREDVQTMSQKAMELYLGREHAKAQELWKKILEIEPENAVALEYMKRPPPRARAAGGYRTSMPDQAASAPPAGGPPTTNTGLQKGYNYLKEEHYPEAIDAFERYALNNPSDPKGKEAVDEAKGKQRVQVEKAYKEGLVAYSQGRAGEAIKLWQNTLRIDPNYQKARQALIKALAETRNKR